MVTAPTGIGNRMSFTARRSQLLEIGSELFRDSPYKDVWIEGVAERAGISRGLLYHYFPTKRDFFLSVLDWNASRYRVTGTAEPGLSAPEQLRTNLRAYVDVVSPRSHAYLAAHRSRQSDPEIRALLDAHRHGQVARIVQRVMEATGSPDAPAPYPVALMVDSFMESLIAMVIPWLTTPQAQRPGVDVLVELISGLFESGLHHAWGAVGTDEAEEMPVPDLAPSASPAGRRLPPEARRRQLLEVGDELFADQEYDEVWIERVAERAGISRGLFYHYFQTKRGFYLAVLEYRGAQMLARQGEIDSLPKDQWLRASLRHYLDYVRSRPTAYKSMVDARHADPEVRPIVESTIGEISGRLLDRAMGEFGRIGPAPEAVVLTVGGWQAFAHAFVTGWLSRPEMQPTVLVELLAGVMEEAMANAFALAEQSSDNR